MVACLLNGCPDTDVVLSEADLTDVISCLAGQTGEDLYDERPADLKIECESYDLRVGERASNKRQRSAGNAAQAALDSARGTRSQGRKGEGLPKKEPLPPGWVAKIITIEDGRRYRKYVAPNGQHFNTYAKAQAQWRSEGYAAGQHPKIRRRGRPPKHVPVNTNPDHKEGPAPRTLQQLLEWQRSIAATIGETEPHQRFYRAVGRAQRSILLVRAR
ncbi:g417 [Coccomyxa viridis]|uniref:G417 protein n=1 Tax=Coccomyxa viridis TaxID=1274662 RepID=A0ABP1FIL2_9CHLO